MEEEDSQKREVEDVHKSEPKIYIKTSLFIEKVKIFFEIFTVFIFLGTLIIGWFGYGIAKKAFEEYKQLNRIEAEAALINMDYVLNKELIDKPYLQSLYAIPPVEMSAEKKAQFLVNICLDSNSKQKSLIVWKDIPDLYNKLWEGRDFHNKHKYRLRKLYNYSENILSLIMNAYSAYEERIIRKESWNTFAGYLRDVGANPIFLCAIYGFCKQGYCDNKSAEIIRRIILEKPENREIVSVIYKDMLIEFSPGKK